MAYTKREAAEIKNNCRSQIKEAEKQLPKKIKDYGKMADVLRNAIKNYSAAKAHYDKKSNGKNEVKLTASTEVMRAAIASYYAARGAVLESAEKISSLFDTLISVCEDTSSREAEKEKVKRNTLLSSINEKLVKADGGVLEQIPEGFRAAAVEETSADVEEASVDGDATENTDTESYSEQAEPTDQSYTDDRARVASVSIAPVTIDVTPYVERAIAATMDKLTQGMERRIKDYVDGLVIPKAELAQTSSITASAAASDTAAEESSSGEAIISAVRVNAELEAHVLEEQQVIFEKLKAMCTSITSTIEGLASLSGEMMKVVSGQREVAELQRQTNDMQRHTMREQQGVQVNQKVVNKDQVELVSMQSVLVDQQRALAEKQSTLAEAQTAMERTQSAVIETQAALEAAMKNVMQTQKEIIAAQQAIIQGNANNVEAQRGMLERQEEIAAAQREALSSQKQVLREQKSITERQLALAATVSDAKGKKSSRTRREDEENDSVVGDDGVTVLKPAGAPDVSSLAAEDFDSE